MVTHGQRGGGRGETEVGGKEVQTIMYKMNKLQRIYCTTQGIQPIFYNKFKWNIIYKNTESWCCTSETIVNLLHTNEFCSEGTFIGPRKLV